MNWNYGYTLAWSEDGEWEWNFLFLYSENVGIIHVRPTKWLNQYKLLGSENEKLQFFQKASNIKDVFQILLLDNNQ